MFHPLVEDPKKLKDADLDKKILDLTKKYHIAARSGQGGICGQIAAILEMFKEEQHARYKRSLDTTAKKESQGLDDLINID